MILNTITVSGQPFDRAAQINSLRSMIAVIESNHPRTPQKKVMLAAMMAYLKDLEERT